MERILLNDELTMICPDGFRILSKEEMDRMQFLEDGPCVCLSDPERHLLASVGWKRPGPLAGLLLNARDLAKNMEKTVQSSLRSAGYHCRGFDTKQIAGNRSEGFSYEYSAQGTEMAGMSYVTKIAGTIYYFNFYARAEGEALALPIWDEMLGSVRRKT